MIDPAVERFVEAADLLVNLIATEPQGSEASKEVHRRALDAAYAAYDEARREVTGDDIGVDMGE